MKRLQRENSPETLGKTSTTNLHAYRVQPLSKSFRKKYHPAEPSTISSASNLAKTFSKVRVKPAVPLRQSPTKPNQRRSHSRGHSRPVDKISLASHAYHQQHNMSTAGKLLRISAIFSNTKGEGAVQSLKELYQQNDEFLQLLFEWQKLQIYDEVDRLVYQLTQIFIRKLETVLQQTHTDMEARLSTYQTTLSRLQQQNKQLKAEKQNKVWNHELLKEMQRRVGEQYQKCQWGNAILQQVRKTGVDMDDFVRKMPLYRYIAYGQDYAASQADMEEIDKVPSSTQPIVHRSQGNIKSSLI